MADRALGILLDSSVVIAHFRKQIVIFALSTPDESLYLSLVVLGELYKGIHKSVRAAQSREILEIFLQRASLLYPDKATAVATADVYAKTAVALERRGQTIPENDIWIAAVALEYNMPLATRDAHFRRVDGLAVIQW